MAYRTAQEIKSVLKERGLSNRKDIGTWEGVLSQIDTEKDYIIYGYWKENPNTPFDFEMVKKSMTEFKKELETVD